MTDDPRSRGPRPLTDRERHAARDSAPSSPSAPGELPALGSVLAGKYEVERVLGAGGMGVVVAARHLQLGQRVALKFMRGDAIHDAGAVERFLREARAAVSLTSEHVTRVLDVGTLESGAPYMVMEYLAGLDLAEVLRRSGRLPIASAVGFVLQASEAIAEAHALGIVHRDLKPANLFLSQRMDRTPFVKVLDFGISKASQADAHQSLTVSGVVMGSPSYMSPEQVRSTKDVDARSDIWSLGVILYELLTGLSPFQGETLGDTFAKITSEAPPPIRQVRPEVPEALAMTIGQCLERDRRARVQTVRDLALRLAEFAPPDAAGIASRIARASGQPEPPRQETLAAPSSVAAGFVGDGSQRSAPMETGPAWLRSGARPPERGRDGRVVAGVLGGAALVCVAAGAYWALGRGAVGKVPAASPGIAAGTSAEVPAPPSTSALPPEAVLPPRVEKAPAPAEIATRAASDEAPPPPRTVDAGRAGGAHVPPAAPTHRPSSPAAPPARAPAAAATPTPTATPSTTATANHETDVF